MVLGKILAANLHRPVMLCVFASIMANADSAFAQEPCPGKPNAHVIARIEKTEPDGTIRRTTRCQCNQGYEPRGDGSCRISPTMGPANPTTMRAETRLDCVRFAGNHLREGLEACRSPIISCLTSAGVQRNNAICAASGLVVAIDPTKVTVLGAVIACGDQIYSMADTCKETWGTCQDGPLKAHREAMAACPSR